MVLASVLGLAGPVQAAPVQVPSVQAAPRPSGPVPAAPLAAATDLPCLPVVACDPAAALAGDAAGIAARASLDAVGGWISDGAVALLGRVGDEIVRTTKPNLETAWFSAHLRVMKTLAVLVVLPLLLASMIGALVHQDPGRLARAVGVQLPLAVLGGFVAVQLTGAALALTDQLSTMVSVGMGNDVAGSIGNIGLAMRAATQLTLNPASGNFLGLLIALLVVIGALLVWLELLVRSAAIYVAVLFLPLTLSGLVWPATARWAKRLIEILIALILSKFVIVAIISLAAGALAADPKDGLSSVLGGAALLLLAGFAPFTLLRLVPVVEASVVGHLEGTARRPVAAGVSSTQMLHRMVQSQAGGAGLAALKPSMGQDSDSAPTIMAKPAQGDPHLLAGFPSSDNDPDDDAPGRAGIGGGMHSLVGAASPPAASDTGSRGAMPLRPSGGTGSPGPGSDEREGRRGDGG